MSNYQEYSWFKEKKDTLATLIDESSKSVEAISLNKYAEGLRQLSRKVNEDAFKIQIVGTFKNGKSTFINSLLGEDILPTKVLPCTAVINEIKYGEQKKAILNFRNPIPDTLITDIPEVTMEHMQKYGMKDIPPMEIEYDNISKYVTIPVDGNPDEISLKSPYLSVELYYPSDLLKEGVEIIDSPGLNECDERTAVTLEYLDKADAIIFLLDATRVCAQDEMETIEDILVPKGFDDMFFVVNRFDCIPEDERDDVKRFVEKYVKSYTTNEIYCVSALQAIQGKIKQNGEYEKSGMPAFEARLSEFLTKDKGRIKLTNPAKELKSILTSEVLFKAIPGQRRQLDTDTAVLRERYEAVKPQLGILESKKLSLKKDLDLMVERKENNIRHAITAQFKEVGNLIPVWINEYTPKQNIGVFGRKSQVKKVSDEISEYINEKVKENFKEWNKEVLTPLTQEAVEEICKDSENNLKSILDEIDSLASEISGTPIVEDNASGWIRALGIAGICCGYVSGANLLSGKFDFKSFAKSLAVDIGVGTALTLLAVTNPVIAIGAVVVVVWNAVAGGQKVALTRLKNDLTSAIRNSIIDNANAKSDEILKNIDNELQKLISAAIGAIDSQVNELKSQIQGVLEEKEKGERFANQRREILNNSESELQRICTKLDDLVFALAEKV